MKKMEDENNERRRDRSKPRIVSHEEARIIEKEPPDSVSGDQEAIRPLVKRRKKIPQQLKTNNKSPKILIISIIICCIAVALAISISQITHVNEEYITGLPKGINEEKYTLLFANHTIYREQDAPNIGSIVIEAPNGMKTEIPKVGNVPFVPIIEGEYETRFKLADDKIFINKWRAVKEPQPKMNVTHGVNGTLLILNNPSEVNAEFFVFCGDQEYQIEIPAHKSHELRIDQNKDHIHAFVNYPDLKFSKHLYSG